MYGDYSLNTDAVAENVVAKYFVKCGYCIRCHSKRKGAGKIELDIVTEMHGGAAAIKVKSGKDRVPHP